MGRTAVRISTGYLIPVMVKPAKELRCMSFIKPFLFIAHIICRFFHTLLNDPSPFFPPLEYFPEVQILLEPMTKYLKGKFFSYCPPKKT